MIVLFLISFLLGCFNAPIIYDHEINRVHDTPIKEVGRREGIYYTSFTELNTREALVSMLSWASDKNYMNDFTGLNATNTYINLVQDNPIAPYDNTGNTVLFQNIGASGVPTPTFTSRRLRFWSDREYLQYYVKDTYFLLFGNDGNSQEFGLEYNVYWGFTNANMDVINNVDASIYVNNQFWYDGSNYNPTDKGLTLYFNFGSTLYQIFSSYFDYLTNQDSNVNYYDSGYLNGNSAGYNGGYNNGYADGYQQGIDDNEYNPEMLTIFTGILDIGLLPVNVFLSIFNFELFGINIAGFISSLLTVSIIIIILRFLFGGKSNDK